MPIMSNDPCAALRNTHATEVASMVAFQGEVSAILNDPQAFHHHGTYVALDALADRILGAPMVHPGRTLLAAMSLKYISLHTRWHAATTRDAITHLFQYAARP